ATAVSFNFYTGTNSANSTSSGGNISSDFTGFRRIPLHDASATLSGSQYWLVLGVTGRTSSVNVWNASGIGRISASQTTMASYFGTASISKPGLWWGVVSTTSNNTTT